MNDDGLTQPELSAYLRILAGLEKVHPYDGTATGDADHVTYSLGFLQGRASALLAVAELVERGEIRGGLLMEPIYRLHTPHLDDSMPDD